ncbi:hypothetical protein IJM16_02690 [Candidatus Saccharibacteria bacterium]|nr:hypothetical protein [Candidatus Saccharibacteria bacterium]
MSDKGGKKEKESLIDLKMILTAIIGVMLGAVFVLTLIFTGILLNERYHTMRAEHTQKEKVVDVVSVTYDEKKYSYYPAINGGDNETDFDSLLRMLGTDKDYYLIQSQTEYANVVSTIESLGGKISTEDFNLPEGFFYSGSLILITAEMQGLTEFKVNSITRNEDYHLRIDVSKTASSEFYGLNGSAILIKVPNIQPDFVEVIRREK